MFEIFFDTPCYDKFSLLLPFASCFSTNLRSKAGICVTLHFLLVVLVPSALGDVKEVGSLVSQHSDLGLVLAFDPVITLAGLSLLVLGLEQ